MGGERGVPHRGQAGLAVGLVLLDDQQLLDGAAGGGAVRVLGRVAERIVHHHGVGHGREDRAQPVLSVQPLGDEGFGAGDGAAARTFGPERFEGGERPVEQAEQRRPRLLLVRALRQAVERRGIADEELVDAHAARVPGAGLQGAQDQQRHDDCPGPVGDLRQVHREPARQQHDLHRRLRHGPPADHAEHRQQVAGEDVAGPGAAVREQRLPRADHVRGVDVVADHLQGEVGLHRRADVERPRVVQRPAAVPALDPAQVDPDLPLQREVGLLAQIVDQEDVFRRDRGVGLEFEHPVTVGLLALQERGGGGVDRPVQRRVGGQRAQGGEGCGVVHRRPDIKNRRSRRPLPRPAGIRPPSPGCS